MRNLKRRYAVLAAIVLEVAIVVATAPVSCRFLLEAGPGADVGRCASLVGLETVVGLESARPFGPLTVPGWPVFWGLSVVNLLVLAVLLVRGRKRTE